MTSPLKCVLLDDELPGLTYLKLLCEEIPELQVVKAFNSPAKFVAEAPGMAFDLCIIDIEMPEMSGLQVAKIMHNKLVIFTTAYNEYAADAFDLDAIDYVRKPVQKARLQQAVLKAVSRFNQQDGDRAFMQWNTDKGKTIIHFNQLAYITTAGNDSRDKTAVFLDGSTVTLKNISFEALSKLLPATQFCRINKREMIALKAVQAYTHNDVATVLPGKGGTPLKLTLSEIYRHEFLAFVTPRS